MTPPSTPTFDSFSVKIYSSTVNLLSLLQGRSYDRGCLGKEKSLGEEESETLNEQASKVVCTEKDLGYFSS
jgi:hypothetical protein